MWGTKIFAALCLTGLLAAALSAAPPVPPPMAKVAMLSETTPAPSRFLARGTEIIDRRSGTSMLFKGIGYSPYLPGETPLQGAAPADDGRYTEHFQLFQQLGVNYLHVFPLNMPKSFFAELDKSNLLYGQDMFVWAYEDDFLDEAFQAKTLNDLKKVIDHTYAVGRPDRLVLFSVGDELQAKSIIETDRRHPQVSEYVGKHLTVRHRTPTEVALARLIDGAIDYELTTYGNRHLYCHTSWTHVGPLADRRDLEVPYENALSADMGDLVCLNVYTYARGVRTSPAGSVTGSSYQGYLEELAAKTNKPILITQVGFSTSPNEPKPWVPGFGGHDARKIPTLFTEIGRDVSTAKGHEKFRGLVFFELNDEWWKSGEDPSDCARHEENDPEEWFGLYSVDEDGHLQAKGQLPEAARRVFSTLGK
ncbi:MAG: hypothetical protein LBU39_02700 [Desulfobulbaceae bacterium]|jgi:hypothetical protein|nr:hypothetical protein [Desulfobulbaceae bacterium]